MSKRRFASTPIALALLLLSAPVAAQPADDEPAHRLLTTEQGEWPAYGGDAGHTRYSPLDQVDASNFGELELAWRFRTDNLGPAPEFKLEGTPLMAGGVLYATGGTRRTVVALDAATGELLWMHREDEGERAAASPRRLSGRGLAYWTDGREARILYGTIGFRLVALDAVTGARVPEFGSGGAIDLKAAAFVGDGRRIDPVTGAIGSNATPTVARDVVVVGGTFADGAAPPTHNHIKGLVQAFDVRTGRRLWTFNTVPRPGEFGADTWLGDSWGTNGNNGVWTQISADPELGIAYLPVESPTGDYYGGHRPGDNLFGESLVAVDLLTGERLWHFQLVHHPLWGFDMASPPILADITVDGREIRAVAQPGKQAFLYVFDRVTGEPVWPIEERPVPQSTVPGERTAPTQPHPTKPPPFDRQGVTVDSLIDFTPELRSEAMEILEEFTYGPLFEPITAAGDDGKRGTILMPGAIGGANWHGAAVDSETGWLYVPSRTQPSVVLLAPPNPDTSDFRYRRARSGGLRGPRGLPLWKPPYVRLSAFDLSTGTRTWMVPLGDGPRRDVIDLGIPDPGPLGGGSYTGPLLTKTLLFLGFRGRRDSPDLGFISRDADRPANPRALSTTPYLLAFDKSTGETVHALELDVAPTGTPMTYLQDGRQFIVLAYGAANDTGLIALTSE